MTPLLGTKTPSAPVGAKSGGDTRAARSLLSCALWRGMGRLWRGMGGMGRPEPLSAQRPHQQQRLSGFHETRNTAFFRITAFLPCRQVRRLQGGMYEAVRKRVERSFSESRDRNNDFFRIPIRFKIRYSPQFVGIRRKDSDKPLPPIKRLRALWQPEPLLHGCIKSPNSLPWPAGLAKWRGEGRTGHESRNTAFDQARGPSRPEFRGFHETRDTRHESRHFFESRPLWPFGSPWVREGWRHRKPPSGPLHPPESHGFPVRHCSLLFTIVRHCSAKNITPEPVSPLRPHRQHGLFGFHETRDTRHESRPLLWLGMGGYGAAWAAYCPAPACLHRQPFSVGLTTSAARRAAPSAANAK